jgi:hypothetical protein
MPATQPRPGRTVPRREDIERKGIMTGRLTCGVTRSRSARLRIDCLQQAFAHRQGFEEEDIGGR